MLDVITLKGLVASGTHGVYDFERQEKKPFVVDVSMWVDISRAAHSDDVDHTVSYADIADDVCAVVEGPSVHLIETLAENIAARILERPRVRGVEVTLHKPQAPISQTFSDVFVCVRRGEFDPTHFSAADNERVTRLYPSTDTAELELDAIEQDVQQWGWGGSESFDAPTLGVEDGPVLVETGSGSPFPSRRQADMKQDKTPFVLGFGGNQGNVPVTLVRALERLIDAPEISVTNVSPLMRTRAVLKAGMEPQADHWNAVVIGETTLAPRELLEFTTSIEKELGRERPYEWAPRTIDIDLITMGQHIIDDDDLQLPHPRAYGRAFVLIPWFLVEPEAEIPGFGTVAELIPLAQDRDGILDAIEDWYENPESLFSDSDILLESQNMTSAEENRAAVIPSATISQPPVVVAAEDSASTSKSEGFISDAFSDNSGTGQLLSFTEAIGEESHSPTKPRVPWKPVTKKVTTPTDELNDVASPTQGDTFTPLNLENLSIAQPVRNAVAQGDTQARPLPDWNFAGTPVTVIDSTDDDRYDVVHQVTPTEDTQSRTILDPELPEGTPVGALPALTPPTATGVPGRRHTMRPTHTGMIPIVKRSQYQA